MLILNNNLVVVKNSQPVTTSLRVAKAFNKQHRNVLRRIKGLLKNEHTCQMFVKSTIINEQNHQRYLFYYMNRDGFSLLIMGFTGKQALSWKIKFIHAFDLMENKLKHSYKLPRTFSGALRQLADQVDANTKLVKQQKRDLPYTNIGKTFYISNHTELIGQFAKVLKQAHLFNGGQNKLFKFLRDIGDLCHYGRNRNLPKQQYVDLGWFRVKHSLTKTFSGYNCYLTTLITPKGQKHYINYFIRRNEQLFGSKYAF